MFIQLLFWKLVYLLNTIWYNKLNKKKLEILNLTSVRFLIEPNKIKHLIIQHVFNNPINLIKLTKLEQKKDSFL